MALRCDLIIRDATLFDGTGAPRSVGDVGVTGDRIMAVGDLGGASADREVIATGKALAPGFIDAHTHDDRAVLCGRECLRCKSSQGVTTVVVGNCGVSLAPAGHRQAARSRRSTWWATMAGSASAASATMPRRCARPRRR